MVHFVHVMLYRYMWFVLYMCIKVHRDCRSGVLLCVSTCTRFNLRMRKKASRPIGWALHTEECLY